MSFSATSFSSITRNQRRRVDAKTTDITTSHALIWQEGVTRRLKRETEGMSRAILTRFGEVAT